MERLPRFISDFRKKDKPNYISELEGQVSKLVNPLTPRAAEIILESPEDKILVYHAGAEKKLDKVVFGSAVDTGRECVFIEFKYKDDYYHVLGGVDHQMEDFSFRSVQKYGPNGYRNRYMENREDVIKYISGKLNESFNAQ